ncbi:MAG: Clp protease N-terminal domain-containing protein, partial [Solirubrobacteraceae bacterium]
ADALRALTAMRREADRLEAQHVTSAIQGGWSWSRVAGELGVSKQAVHRKHAQRVKDLRAVPKAKGPRGGRVLITSEARRTMQLAREEAQALGEPVLGTEHLLLGILRCRYTPAVKVLQDLGVRLAEARGATQPTIEAVGAEPVPNGFAQEESVGKRASVSKHARAVLERSLHEAVERGDGYLSVEHLLLALIRDEHSGAARTLERLEVSPLEVRRRLELAL